MMNKKEIPPQFIDDGKGVVVIKKKTNGKNVK